MMFPLRGVQDPSPSSKTYFMEGPRTVSVSQSRDNSRLENSMRNIEVQEDDIMKKYGDLFTAPDFLMQCKISIQNFGS